MADRGGVSRPSSSPWTRTRLTPSSGELGHGDQMPVVGVDAAGTDQADQVKGVIGLLRPGAQLQQDGRLKKLPVEIDLSIRGRSWRTG